MQNTTETTKSKVSPVEVSRFDHNDPLLPPINTEVHIDLNSVLAYAATSETLEQESKTTSRI